MLAKPLHVVDNSVRIVECAGRQRVLRIVAAERFCELVVDELCIVGLLETESNCLEADSWST